MDEKTEETTPLTKEQQSLVEAFSLQAEVLRTAPGNIGTFPVGDRGYIIFAADGNGRAIALTYVPNQAP